MRKRQPAKAPSPRLPAADVRLRPQEKRASDWRPELPNMDRSELRRIIIEMIG
jgi:hypothetical protein